MSQEEDGSPTDRATESVLGERLAFEPLDQFRARSAVVERMFGTRPSPRQVGRFELKGRIGSGAMSTVYLAHDPTLRRQVALKIISAPTSDAQGHRARVLDEARALAQLAHPNVVQVFGVAAVEDRLLMVMEYVEGENLRQWLASRRPTPEQIIDAMVQAGRGLAAAHEAGIVHRDIKPENILRSTDGRIAIVDFGLAAALPGPEDPLASSAAVAGSPAYLATPQLRGEPADEASDLFAYCVTMYEALAGCRPFPDPTDALAVRARSTSPPAPDAVPRWLWRILERGLNPRTVTRHQSVAELVESLEQGRNARRRPTRYALATLGVLAFGGTAAFLASSSGQGQRCASGPAEFRRTWETQTRAELHEALRRHGTATGLDPVLTAFDDYGERWAATHRLACETGASGKLDARGLDGTMQCLRHRRADFTALVRVLEGGDRDTIRDAGLAVRQIRPPESCQGAQAADELPPEIVAALSEARAHGAAGLYARGIAALEPHAQYGEGLPGEASIAYHLGTLYDRSGDSEQGRIWLERALWSATAAGDDALVLRAVTSLVHVVGFGLANYEDGAGWAEHARAVLRRRGAPDQASAALETAEGLLQFGAGHFVEARAHFETSLALHRRAGTDGLAVAEVHTRLGNIAFKLGQPDESARHHTAALDLRSAELGEQHPMIGETLANLANAQIKQGAVGEGRATMLRSLEVLSASLGAKHPVVGIIENNLGNLEADHGNDDAALRHYTRGLEVSTAALGDDHPRVATLLDNSATVLRRLGDIDKARAQMETALSIRERRLGSEHPDVAYSCMNLGNLEAGAGNDDRAMDLQQRALAIERAIHGDDHANTGSAVGNIAALHLGAGEFERALAGYDEALAILDRTLQPNSPRFPSHLKGRAEARLALGQRVGARRDLERALEILTEAGGPAALTDDVHALLAELGE